MSRFSQALVASAFAAWLATPLILLLLGHTSDFAELEKRPAAESPKLTAAALFDSRFYAGLTATFADRIPLRVEAVAADAWIDMQLFGDSPSPGVLLGKEGWLFSRDSIMARCDDDVTPREVVASLRQIDRIFRASGRRFLLLIAPNKEAIYPEYLGSAEGLTACTRNFRREVRSLLEGAGIAEYIDLWEVLESLKARTDGEVYWPHDTHWTSESALEATRQIVERLAPDLWDESEMVISPARGHRGDLADVIGLPTWDYTRSHDVDRAGRVATVKRHRGRFTRLAAPGEAFPQPVLVVLDSFGRMIQGNLAQFLADSTWIAWPTLSSKASGSMIRQFSRAEVIIVQSVERALSARFGRRGKELAIHLAGHLLGELPATRLDFEQARGRGYQLQPRGLVPEAGATRVIFDLPARASGVDRYVVVAFDRSEIHPVIEVKRRGQRWQDAGTLELKPMSGRQRVGVVIPPAAELVSIRRITTTMREVWLLDLP